MIDYEKMWGQLFRWIAERHDFHEGQYLKTNFSADAVQLNAYRSVIQGMQDMESRAKAQDPTKAPASARAAFKKRRRK